MEAMKELRLYADIEAQIEVVKDACNFIPDATSKDGYEKSKRVSLDVGKLMTALENSRKEQKAESLRIGRAIDAEAKDIRAKLEEIQAPHKEAYKAIDDEKKKREADRVAGLQSRISELRDAPETMSDASSDEIKACLEWISAEECLDFYEFTQDALIARNNSKEKLASMFSKALEQEEQARELKELRALQAEQQIKAREDAAKAEAMAEVERLKQAAKDAELQAERDKLAAIEAEQLRQKREQEAIEASKAKRKADERHVSDIRRQAKESLMTLGLSESDAKSVVLAINAGKIANVSIQY